MGSAARELDVGAARPHRESHPRPSKVPVARPPRTATKLPQLSREGLRWCTSGANVDILVEVRNPGLRPSTPGVLIIEAAPLGAFVPGQEIARVPVLALDPGGRRLVPVTVARTLLPTTPAPGDWDRVFGAMLRWGGLDRFTSADWVGNLNVWFDVAPEHAVEAHRALDLKITAGRRAGMSVYLPSAAGEFDFAISEPSSGWSADLEPAPWGATFIVGAPAAGNRAAITLAVTRRSDGRTVPIEFTVVSVEGDGDHLGCLRV